MNTSCLRALGSVLFLLSTASCLHVARPYPRPSVEQVLASLSARARNIQTLRGEAKALYRGPPRRVTATVRFMAAQPNNLRFDLVSPFDSPIATLVCRDRRFRLLDTQHNRSYHGPATPCNLARLLRVALLPEHVFAIVVGSTPLIPYSHQQLRWDERAGVEQIDLSGDQGSQIIRVDGRSRRWDLLSSEVRDAQGRTTLRIRASAYRLIGGHAVPQQLLIEQPEQRSAVELRLSSEQLNLELPAAAFQLPTTQALTSQYVDCPQRSHAAPDQSLPDQSLPLRREMRREIDPGSR